MSRYLPLLALCSLIGLSSCSSQPEQFRVTALKQGLVTFNAANEAAITTEGNHFIYQPNGSCALTQWKKAPCLWHGFEITYESTARSATINCMTELDKAGAATKTLAWDFTVEGRQGNHIHPQYTILKSRPSAPHQESTTCWFNGQEVFRYDVVIEAEPAAKKPARKK